VQAKVRPAQIETSNIVHDIVSNIVSDIQYNNTDIVYDIDIRWIMVWLYQADDANPLIDDLGTYILDKLGTFQNMQDTCKVTAETDINDYVGTSTVLTTLLLDKTKIYRFSTELLAYIEMCVAFSPYYREGDARTAGAMDMYFRDALEAYADVPYNDHMQTSRTKPHPGLLHQRNPGTA
jgi:hypothetical protein